MNECISEAVSAGVLGVPKSVQNELLGKLKSGGLALKPVTTVVKHLPCVDPEPEAKTTWIKAPDGSWKNVDARTASDAAAANPAPPTHLHGPEEEVHGHLGANKGWARPALATFCDLEARSGYATRKAHEYLDTPEVLATKMDLLADMVRRSSNMIAYTGAGISTSSGIPDYATQTSEGVVAKSRPQLMSLMDAQPTEAHRALAALNKAGYLKKWVQQNHDGLPQKAGVPQQVMNEIHGAWQDPSNPVVPMSGALRGDLFEDMMDWERRTDLCLAMGTSLCGMNADRCATTVGARAVRREEGVLGLVIVNLQQTQHDRLCALRLFAPIDEVMRGLAYRLAVPVAPEGRAYVPPSVPAEDLEACVFRVPYGPSGALDTTGALSTLNLTDGAPVMITDGTYKGDTGTVCGRTREGHFRVTVTHRVKASLVAQVPTLLGLWWVEAAVRGAVPALPVVNA